MISEKHKFVFVHVPKTGGNSVQTCLLDYSEGEKSFDGEDKDGVNHFDIKHTNFSYSKHSPIRVYQKDLGVEGIKSYYVFAVMRNPWDWCVSWFFHRGGRHSAREYSKDAFTAFIKQMPSLRDYVTIESVWARELNRLLKQCKFDKRIYTQPIDGMVDFFIRFEHLEEDFNKVLKALSLPEATLPHVNKGSRKSYVEYYDDDLRELVARKFKDEIELGGYQFEAAPAN